MTHRLTRLLSSVAVLATACASEGSAPLQKALSPSGTPIGSGFLLEPVVEGLFLGLDFEVAPDGTFYIAEKGGTVRVARGGTLLPQPFIDISGQVNNISDRGLLGIALHPGFPAQPYVYLLFTYDPPETFLASGLGRPDEGGARVARLVRITADAAEGYARAVPGSEVVLLGTASTWSNIGDPFERNEYAPPSCGERGDYVRDCIPADELSHTIGTVTFGPDGMLYVGSGDGCSYVTAEPACTRALDLDSLAGKVLRIDPLTGDAPSDNPYFDGDPHGNRSKVFQLGLRNPFRFTIEPGSGDVYIGDVGWNTWEEINRGAPGANFGWPCYEGIGGSSREQPGYRDLARCDELRSSDEPVTPALYAYDHGGTSSSVQVGDFYLGDDYPAEFQGALFYTDYNKQELRYLTFDGAGGVTGSSTLATGVSGVTQLSRDPVSEDLLMMRIGASGSARIERLHYQEPRPGDVPSGVYTLGAQGNDGCVEALPETRFFIWVTRPAAVETRACDDDSSQKWAFEAMADGSYRILSEAQNVAMGVNGSGIVPVAPDLGDATQRFQLIDVAGGFLLSSFATGECVAVASTSTNSDLGLAPCEDVADQRFTFTPDGNFSPTLEPIPDQSASVEDGVSLQVVASDPEGAPLVFTATGLPPGVSIDAASGLIEGAPSTGGTFDVTVRVTDGFNGVERSFTFTVTDDRVPVVDILQPQVGATYRPGQLVPFAAEARDWQGAPLAAEQLAWSLYLHHNQHVHFDGIPPTAGTSGAFLAGDHGDGTWLELCVTATDAANRTTETCRPIHPEEVEYTIDTLPSGLAVPWEGVLRTTPFTVTTHVGGVRDLNAPVRQGSYVFGAWSDGGAASHSIVVGEEPLTLVATYERSGPTPGPYQLVSAVSGKCIEYRSASYFLIFQIEPARFEQFDCDEASNQRFDLAPRDDGTYGVVSASGRALAVDGGSTESGAAIVPASPSAAASQRWRFEPASAGYALRNESSELCLAVAGGSSADGTGFVQSPCSSSAAQQFELVAN